MNKDLIFLKAISIPAYFEGDELPAAPAADAPPAPPARTFTQEEVNKMMASDKRNQQAALAQRTTELLLLQESVNMTAEERDSLKQKVSELDGILLTKEELAKRELERTRNESKNALSLAQTEAKTWKTKHDTMLITAALTDAVSVEGQRAYSPKQVVALFGGQTVIHEDSVTKELSVKVNLNVKGTDGQVKTLVLDPKDAMKEVAGMEEYANLFQFDGKGGLNRQKNQTTQQLETVPRNLADYKANREQYIKKKA